MALRILELRRAAGLTQVELAERLRVSHTMVQRWESGTHTVFEAKVRAVAAALGCHPGELLEALPPARRFLGLAEREAIDLIARMSASQCQAWLAMGRAALEPAGGKPGRKRSKRR